MRLRKAGALAATVAAAATITCAPPAAAQPTGSVAERVENARADLQSAQDAETEAREAVKRHTTKADEARRAAATATATAQRATRNHHAAAHETRSARRELGNLAATNYQVNAGMSHFVYLISASGVEEIRNRAGLIEIAQQSQDQLLAKAQTDLANAANDVAAARDRAESATSAHAAATDALAESEDELAAATDTRTAAEEELAAAEDAYAAARKADQSRTSNTRITPGAELVLPSAARITSPYGMRVHPITGVYKLHSGTDFGADCGSATRAAAAGTVTSTGPAGAYGNQIRIDHGAQADGQLETTYNHLSSIGVAVGQTVTAGEVIGRVGTTGSSTGCHLHFEVLVNGEFTDPMEWLQ